MNFSRASNIAASLVLALTSACGTSSSSSDQRGDRATVAVNPAAGDSNAKEPIGQEQQPAHSDDVCELKAPVNYKDHIAKIVEKSCLGCHNAQTSSADVNLASFTAGDLASRDLWLKAFSAAKLKIMPPQSGVALRDCELTLLGAWVDAGMPYEASETPVENAPTGLAAVTACTAAPSPTAERLRRLTKAEYTEALNAAFGSTFSTRLTAELDKLSADDATLGFSVLSDNLSGAQIDGYFSVAEKVGALMTTDAALRSQVVGACVTNTNATQRTACVTAFIAGFGQKIFRRPLADDEKASFMTLYNAGLADSFQDGLALIVRGLLTSPDFLYKVETRGTLAQGSTDILRLSGYEVATRLAFVLTGAPPDPTLTAAATDGSLLTDNGVKAQAVRILETPAARAAMKKFYREWLAMDQMGLMTYSPAFLGGISTTGLRTAMIDEALAFADDVTFTSSGTFADLMLSRKAFVADAALGQIYGVPASASPVTLDATRAGILTRAAMLATGADATNPPRRGKSIRARVLCDVIELPDPNSVPPGSFDIPPVSATATTRERFESKTSGPGCIGCHAKVNPLGFVLEGFDSLGRARTLERIFSGTQVVAELPIDTKVDPSLERVGESVITNAAQLSGAIAASVKAPHCFSRNLIRYAHGRLDQEADACLAQNMLHDVAKGASIKDLIVRLVTSEEFRVRKLDP